MVQSVSAAPVSPLKQLVDAARRLWARPGAAVAIVAALAVIASAYPVVFLGKSHVSPNFGTPLLYQEFPSLPGYAETKTRPVHGSDVGAIMWQNVPYSMVQHRALFRDRALPVWNRYNSAGVPLLGQGQSMFGDPLHLLVVAADGASWAWDLKFLLAKWLFAAGLGLLVLAVTGHRAAALITALAAPFAGFFVFRINHPAFFSLCYAPWPLYCWVRTSAARSFRAVGGWAAGLIFANLALACSGTAKEASVLLLFMNFAGACVLLTSEASWRVRLARLAALAWAGVLFVLISAPLWSSFLDTLRSAYTSSDANRTTQLRPSVLLGAFDEALFRPLREHGDVSNPSASFLILAGLLYLLATFRDHRPSRAVGAIAATTLVPLAIAFGGIPRSWICHLPLIGRIGHVDNTCICSLIILWSILAGAGFAAAATRLGGPRGRGDLAIAGAVLLALAAAYSLAGLSGNTIPGGTDPDAVPAFPTPVRAPGFIWGYLPALIAATIGMGLIARRALSSGRTTRAQRAALAFCAFVMLWRQGLHAEAGFTHFTIRPPVRVDFHAPSPAIQSAQARLAADPGRCIGLGHILFSGWSGVYSLEGVSGPDALMSPYYRELMLRSPLPRDWDWRFYVTRERLAAARPWLDFLNVRFYLGEPGRLAGEAGLHLVRSADLDLGESPTAWPRAFFTDRLAVYSSMDEFAPLIASSGGKPFGAIDAAELAAHPELKSLVGDSAARTFAPGSRYTLTENSTSFEVRASGSGVAILTEVWWPGHLRAELDGRAVPVIRLNHAFAGVSIPGAGNHQISIRHEPPHLRIALTLSATGFGLLALSGAALLVFGRANGRQNESR